MWYRRATPGSKDKRQRLFGLSRRIRRPYGPHEEDYFPKRSVSCDRCACLWRCWPSSCLPKPPAESGDITITLYGFSVMKESLEKAIFPGFTAKWKQQHGQVVQFQSSFAGSETVTNQILRGAPADVAILSIERDAQRLQERRICYFRLAFVAGQGNRQQNSVRDHRAQGKSERDSRFFRSGEAGNSVDPSRSDQFRRRAVVDTRDLRIGVEEVGKRVGRSMTQARALQTLRAIWKNVISTPGSAREARTTFELGNGDALITYELEGLLMKEAKAPIEIVMPQSTIFSEHPAVVIDKNVTAAKRAVIDAFMQYLWSDEAQQAFVKFHFYSSTNDAFNQANTEFGHIEMPFTIEYFGGWDKAYPEVIEKVFRDQVQRK